MNKLSEEAQLWLMLHWLDRSHYGWRPSKLENIIRAYVEKEADRLNIAVVDAGKGGLLNEEVNRFFLKNCITGKIMSSKDSMNCS